MSVHIDMLDVVARLKTNEEAFVLATVVRTVSVTAAKAGAKAVIDADGKIIAGWIGGGCARGAVLTAARDALLDGCPRMVSVQPENLLRDLGVTPGEQRDGIRFARNMCPSLGTMDIFIEPVLPQPALIVLGGSPVAMALCELAHSMGFHTTLAAPPADRAGEVQADVIVDTFDAELQPHGRRFIVVSTQGRGDEAAMRAALKCPADYLAFVGSRRKMTAIHAKLSGEGVDLAALNRVKAPAGLDLGAITPDEIALSILAEITQHRRRGQRAMTA